MKRSLRQIKDALTTRVMFLICVACTGLAVCVAIVLLVKSSPIIVHQPLVKVLFSSSWQPARGSFGMYPFILGTLWVTGIAVIFAVPVSLLTSIYLAEYASRTAREIIRPFLDILAGIPSVIFGMWGVIIIVPFVRGYIAPLFGVHSTGYSVLAGGIVLAVMILPVIIHITVEVFSAIPHDLREASLALGATRWQTVTRVLLRKAFPGVVAANLLGLTRALGETMAVLMVCGNIPLVPKDPFSPCYPIPALIANTYGEMMSIPLYDAALMLAAFMLFMVVMFFTILSRMILHRIKEAVI